MLGGLDIGRERLLLVTRTGTTRHTAPVGESGDATGLTPAATELETAVTGLLDDHPDGPPGNDDRVGYVDWSDTLSTPLAHVGDERDTRFEPVDPGMAVCYDVFGPAPSGLGIAIGDGVAVATLAVEGVPVATARQAYDGHWYDVTDSAAVVSREGPRAAWASVQYETLFEELASEIAAGAPALGAPVDVALGGSTAPELVGEHSLDVLGDALGTEVASVAVAETPDEALARGALTAVEETTTRDGPVPAFAATKGYAPSLADAGAATVVLAEGVDRPTATPHAVDGTERTATAAAQTGAERERERIQQRTRRYQARLASALDRLVEQVDDEAAGDRLATLREELDESLAQIEAELDELAERTPPAGAVTSLESSVTAVEDEIESLEDDVADLQSALAGLDEGDSLPEDSAGDTLGSVATDALKADIEDVEQDLASRIEGLWTELDDVNDELVDLAARVGDLPDIEERLDATARSVDSLSSETTDLQQSLTNLHDQLDKMEQQAATTAELQGLQTDLDALASDLEEFRSTFRTLDRADPAEVDEISRDLDALRETVVDHAKRLDGVERTVSDLDDRITQAFQDTAKAEALSSLQAEVSRVRDTASAATEQATDATEATEELDDSVQSLDSAVDQLRQTVDGLAGSSATRSEIEDLQAQVDELQAEQQRLRGRIGEGTLGLFPLTLITVGLGSVSVLGALLAIEISEPVFAVGFVVLGIGSAVWLWLTVSNL